MENNILSDLFSVRFGTMPDSVSPLPVSGSHRRYFRLSGGGSSAIGVAGTDFAENRAFCTIAGHFRSKGINVPEVYGISGDGMYYLQEDLGDISLFDYVADGRKGGDYSLQDREMLLSAVSGLPKIQFEGAAGLDFGVCCRSLAFDGRMVMFDLNYFKYCFLKTLGLEFDEVRLQADFDKLRDDISSVPSDGFLYRDFQSRNVMVKDGKPYYIDFQGGMKGPMYYDLASFVWQARARYPQDLKDEMIAAYLEALAPYRHPEPDVFNERLRLFVLVRTLQVLGAYGFRGCFERKEHFLKSIPSAIRNIEELLAVPFVDYPYLDSVLRRIVEAFDRGETECLYEDNDRSSGRTDAGTAGGTGSAGKQALTVTVYSFSYKKGIPLDDSGNGGGYVFDCRSIHNPGKYDRYKSLTGMDAPVIRFLEDDGEVFRFMDNVYALVDAHVGRFLQRGFTHLMVSFGCTGGQHRSVYCAESLARHLAGIQGVKVRLVHREQHAERIL